MDRADAPPDQGVGGAVPARSGGRWRAGSLPRRTACAEGQGRAVTDPPARRSARIRAPRGAGAGRVTRARARGLVPQASACRGGAAARRGGGPRGPELPLAADPRPADALGELLDERCDELQLEAAAGAGRDPRLRGRARGGPPGRAGPLASVLEAARVALAPVARARGVAAAARARAAAVVPRPGCGPRPTTAVKGGGFLHLAAYYTAN